MGLLGFKARALAASAGLALAAFFTAQDAMAADVLAACENGPAGTLTAGYLWGGADQDFFRKKGVTDTLENDYHAFFGEAAGLYHFCDMNVNVQLDGALHAFAFDDDNGIDEQRWHLGGVLFWRNSDVGLLGLDASYIAQDYDTDFVPKDNDQLRFGLRGEFFLNDIATVGAGGGYFTGQFFNKDIAGFDANAWARIYPHENVSILGRFDYSSFDFDEGISGKVDFWSVSGEIEGKLPEWPVAGLVGARYGEFDANFLRGLNGPEEHTQLYLGLRIYLGGDTSSLRAAHRSNTVDNTNMRWERFPEVISFLD